MAGLSYEWEKSLNFMVLRHFMSLEIRIYGCRRKTKKTRIEINIKLIDEQKRTAKKGSWVYSWEEIGCFWVAKKWAC